GSASYANKTTSAQPHLPKHIGYIGPTEFQRRASRALKGWSRNARMALSNGRHAGFNRRIPRASRSKAKSKGTGADGFIVELAWRRILPSFSQPFRRIVWLRSRKAVQEGVPIVSGTSGRCCRDGIVAAGRRFFRLSVPGRRRAGQRHLWRRHRHRGLIIADRPVEGRPFARRLRRGEAARGRAVADRARWTSRSQ